MRLNLNQLQYFVSVAETGSFTKAAAIHYISQTAITQQIRSLEETVGTKLVDRNSRPAVLTAAGKVLLKEAREILGKMDAALSKTREAATGLQGELRIGYTKGYEHSELPKHLRQFHHTYPNVLLSCYRCDTDMQNWNRAKKCSFSVRSCSTSPVCCIVPQCSKTHFFSRKRWYWKKFF